MDDILGKQNVSLSERRHYQSPSVSKFKELFDSGMGVESKASNEVGKRVPKLGLLASTKSQKYFNRQRDHFLQNGTLNLFEDSPQMHR